LGDSFTGKVAPETANPDPLIVAAFIVSVPEPVEVTVSDCVAGIFTETVPNTRLVVLMLNVASLVVRSPLSLAESDTEEHASEIAMTTANSAPTR
jgi:hypothetical protein